MNGTDFDFGHFARAVGATGLLAFGVMGSWMAAYRHTCLAFVPFLFFWGVIATGLIDEAMHRRRCFRNCYLHAGSFFAKVFLSPFFVTLVSIALSFAMAASAFFVLIETTPLFWGYLVAHLILIALLCRGMERLFQKTVQEAYLPFFARKWSGRLAALPLLAVLIWVTYEGAVPGYLQPTLYASIFAATNSVGSDCGVLDTVLRLHKEIDAIAWWLMTEEFSRLQVESLRVGGWMLFLLSNSLAALGLNRFLSHIFCHVKRRLQ